MDVFWRNGYAGTTPQLLLDELGIGKGSFYNAFESKHQLFVSALEKYKDRRIDYLTGSFAAEGPVRPRIEAALYELTGLGTHAQGCLMVNSVAELAGVDAGTRAVADDLFAGIESAFREAIESGRRSGEFSSATDPAKGASSLLTTLIGTSILLKMRTDPTRAVRSIAEAVEAL